VRQDVGRRGRGVAGYNDPAANKDGEYARKKVINQKKPAILALKSGAASAICSIIS